VEGLLDDLDELLLALNPLRNTEEFALAASLHRALDELAILRKEASTMRSREKALSTHDRLRPGTF
jgi:hypothetical protein